MDKTDDSVLLRLYGLYAPLGPLKTLFTHLITDAIPSFCFLYFAAGSCHKPSMSHIFVWDTLVSEDRQRIVRSRDYDIIFFHTYTDYNSRLFGSIRKSNIPIVTMPDSSRRIFILSRTRMIFLNESLTFWNGRLSCASFSGVARLNADCR